LSYKIKIFDDIHNADLKEAWIKLQQEHNTFPQMYYEWIEPWVRLRFGKRKLHIVTVTTKDQIIAIAPFCIENIYLLNVLRSIPIHFGDFYYPIIENEREVFQLFIEYFKSYKKWNIVELNQVNSDSKFGKLLTESYYPSIKLSNIIYTKTDYPNFEIFLKSISTKQRKEYRRRLKRLKELDEVKLVSINSKKDFLMHETQMKNVYLDRWGYQENENIFEVFLSRREAYGNCLDKKVAKGFLLFIGNELAAYRLGFIDENIFTSWKLVYNLKYSKYGIGHIISILVIENLIRSKIKKINNGVGDYSYKLKWFESKIENSNYSYFLSKNIFSKSYIFYKKEIKPFLKKKLKK